MKVRFIKAHEGFKVGDEEDVNSARAKAYINDGLAEMVTKGESLEKKELKVTKEKKDNAGPGK